MNNLKFRYTFTMPDGSNELFDLEVDAHMLRLVDYQPQELPMWTRLDYHQCPNCPGHSASGKAHCPLAINLIPIVERFKGVLSHDEIHVVIETSERTISQSTTAQRGISALMGLLIATSDCPQTHFFKPMVRFHLPFATEDETLWRASATYLIAQYFLKRKGYDPDIEMQKLPEIYENIREMNISLTRRLQAAIERDSTVNALILLDIFASSISFSIDEFWDEKEYLFTPFLKQQIKRLQAKR